MAGDTALGRSARSVWIFLSWVYISIIGLLVLWVLLAVLFAGWRPLIVTSDSMRPSIRAGDVVLLSDPPRDLLAPGAIVAFESDGDLVTHRIVDLADDRYVTRGDANASNDAHELDVDDVQGIGRLVVPFAGLPVSWLQSGNFVALAMSTLLSIGALATAVATSKPAQRRERRTAPRINAEASIGLRRVRVLAVVLLIGQYMANPGVLADVPGNPGPHVALALAVIGLLGVNAISMAGERRRDDDRPTFAIAEILADAALTVSVMLAAEDSSVLWLLLALPIIGAVSRFRVIGALGLWAVMAVIVVSVEFLTIAGGGDEIVESILDLRRSLERLGIVLIVMLPAGYLLERLLVDIGEQRAATKEAGDRSHWLRLVASSTQRLNRLDAPVEQELLSIAQELGHPHAALFLVAKDGAIRMPHHVGDRSAARILEAGVPFIERTEPGTLSARTVRATEWIALFCDLAELSSHERLVMAMLRPRSQTEAHHIEAVELFVSHAQVALANDRLVGSLREMHDQLEVQAMFDALTGLPNRRNFQKVLSERMSLRGRDRVAVLFVDLDGFKSVNDALGHEAGDSLLVDVARRFEAVAPAGSFVARLGGDEFTLIPPLGSVEDAVGLGNRLCQALADPVNVAGESATVGASVGVAIAGFQEADELIRRADVAMYAAKSAGRGRVELYDGAIEDEDRRLQQLRRDFPVALFGDELTLAFQPIMDARHGGVIAAEALLRWTHRSWGPVAPPQTVRIAEQAGLGFELGDWVLNTALSQVGGLLRDGRLERLSVNLSSAQLEDVSGLMARSLATLERHDIEPSKLVLELSETIGLPDADLIEELEGLRRAGLGLALDDFGTGQTTLTHLRSLPLDWLKIDRAFMKDIDEGDGSILASLIDVAHGLNLTTVLEGVENQRHAAAVEALDVDFVQGFHFHPPMTGADLNARVTEKHGRPQRAREVLR